MKIVSLLVLVMTTTSFAQFQNSRMGDQPNRNIGGSKPTKIEYVPGEYVVKMSQGTPLREIPSSVGKIVNRFKINNSNYALVKSNQNLSELNLLRNDMGFEIIEPNFIYRKQGERVSGDYTSAQVSLLSETNVTDYIPADEFFGKLWGLDNKGDQPSDSILTETKADIDALAAWKISTGDKKVIVAVIDTGIDYQHPDLVNNIWTNEAELKGQAGVDDDNNGVIDDLHGANFSTTSGPNGNPMDDHSHGTHCAGTIGGVHDSAGVAGVMANVSLMGVKFLTASGSGSLDGAVKAIDYATKMGAHVLSNSWGGGGRSQILEDAIKAANTKGIVFVAAAGNNGSNSDSTPMYPASYQVENVVSIAAHDINDSLASFSNYGAKTVHLAAPGVKILSTVINKKYAAFSGTSMATPHVSGVVGLMIAKSGIGTKTPKMIRDALISSANAAPAYSGRTLSGGRASAAKAISVLALRNNVTSGFQTRRNN